MFDIGQKVVCVDDSFETSILQSYVAFPIKDKVYTVRDVIPGLDYDLKATCAILLTELVNPPNPKGVENGFAANRFRELDTETEKETTKEKEPIYETV